jgi:hypothetical protein
VFTHLKQFKKTQDYILANRRVWLIIVWLIRDFLAWMFIHKPLREKTKDITIKKLTRENPTMTAKFKELF